MNIPEPARHRRHHACIPGGEHVQFRVMLGLAIEAVLERLNHAQLAALVLCGEIYVPSVCADRRRLTANDLVVAFGHKVGQAQNDRELELVAGFQYLVCELSGSDDPDEVPAEEHPDLARFLMLGREDMLPLLRDYAWSQVMDFCDF